MSMTRWPQTLSIALKQAFQKNFIDTAQRSSELQRMSSYIGKRPYGAHGDMRKLLEGTFLLLKNIDKDDILLKMIFKAATIESQIQRYSNGIIRWKIAGTITIAIERNPDDELKVDMNSFEDGKSYSFFEARWKQRSLLIGENDTRERLG